MKYFFGLIITISIFSCSKPCRECKYSNTKQTFSEKFCSSIKSDREAFIAKWDSLAIAAGTVVVCTKENY